MYLRHYKSPTAPLDMHHLTCGMNSLLHSVTLLLVHLILRISPHHSHHICSHHLSLPRPFTPDLKLISFTNPFLHSHSYSFRTDFTDLTGVVCFSFFFCLRALDKAEYSAFESTLNSSIVSYLSYRNSFFAHIFIKSGLIYFKPRLNGQRTIIHVSSNTFHGEKLFL